MPNLWAVVEIWRYKKDFIRTIFSFFPVWTESLLSAFIWFAAFLHMLLIRLWNVSRLSISTPNNVNFVSLFKEIPLISINCWFMRSCLLGERNMRWNFSGFAIISLASVQFKAASVSLISNAFASSIVGPTDERLLSSAKLNRSASTESYMSFEYTLNNKTPSNEPYGTPDFIWRSVLRSPFTFTVCVLSIRHE